MGNEGNRVRGHLHGTVHLAHDCSLEKAYRIPTQNLYYQTTSTRDTEIASESVEVPTKIWTTLTKPNFVAKLSFEQTVPFKSLSSYKVLIHIELMTTSL